MRRLNINRSNALVITLLVLTIPLSLWAVTQETRLKNKALEPISIPVTYPSTNCYLQGNTVYLVPDTQPGCHDIQYALNLVPYFSTTQYKLKFSPGDYYTPNNSSNPFSLQIINKSNLIFEGDSSSGSNGVRFNFHGHRGGISITNSHVSMQWISISGSTSNGLVYTSNSSLEFLYAHLFNYGSTTLNATSNLQLNIANTEFRYGINAIQITGGSFNITNSTFSQHSTGVSIANASGSVKFNLFDNLSSVALTTYDVGTVEVTSNTFVNNGYSSQLSPIYIENPTSSQTITLNKNLIAFNNYGLHAYPGTNTLPSSFSVTNNIFYNTPINFLGFPDVIGSNGNISQDPLLDWDNEYCLLANSPAILSSASFIGHRGPCRGIVNPDLNGDYFYDFLDLSQFSRSNFETPFGFTIFDMQYLYNNYGSSTLPPTPSPTPQTPIVISLAPSPSPTTQQAAVCGNNICEPNEYVACPTGAQCIWAGSCPSDCDNPNQKNLNP